MYVQYIKYFSQQKDWDINHDYYLVTIATRLHDFVIYVTTSMPVRGQSDPDPEAAASTVCITYDGTAPQGLMESIRCESVMVGRYVIIQIPGNAECLQLCEVEIYSKSSIW